MSTTSPSLTIKRYYWLAKPGIIYANLFAAVSAYMFGANGFGDFSVLCGLIIGVIGVIACGCVVNNIYDTDIDIHMERTKTRSLVTKKISVMNATIYAVVLGLVGFTSLVLFTNKQTVLMGFLGLVFYVPIYTIAKRKTVHGTLIGTISGATPPVAGYAAATGHFDVTALLLFLVLVSWQMPHFYAIAIRRFDDYKKAGIPVLPVVRGVKATILQIRLYILLLLTSIIFLIFQGDTGYFFSVFMLLLVMYWLRTSLTNPKKSEQTMWAKKVFLQSLLVLVGYNVALALSVVLP